jgi:RNA polymerase sigma-70 factor (ECF subfamily)
MAITSTFDPAAALPAAGDEAAMEREHEERALVARARRGDASAFRALVERHQARAVALARRVLRDQHEAEEAAQDAFLKAWAALPGFREEARFGTWLHRIVFRRALDRLDSLKARRRHEAAAPVWPEASGPEGGRDAAALERIRRHVDALPAAQRAAITLFYFEDRSVLEAARVLDMHENTLKTHLHRARAALRAAWSREEEASR